MGRHREVAHAAHGTHGRVKSRLLAAIGLSALTWASAQAAMAQTPARLRTRPSAKW